MEEQEIGTTRRHGITCLGGCLGSLAGGITLVALVLYDHASRPPSHESGSDIMNGLIIWMVPGAAIIGLYGGALLGLLIGFIASLIDQRRRAKG